MRVYTQQNGIFISGKIKEARLLLAEYARRYRTVKEMIKKTMN
ncbi:MAG: Z-ring formation inhibitor MciZ [Desulfotomaculaceae bacterium]|nr:Z-ring formation inhibitor MciZ [Desulfotomaculaceae bacterium]